MCRRVARVRTHGGPGYPASHVGTVLSGAVATVTAVSTPGNPWSVPLAEVIGSTAKAIEAGLGISTAGRLLDHVPRRYADRGELTPIRELRTGEQVTVLARVETSTVIPYGRRRPGGPPGRGRAPGRGGDKRLEVVITDGRDRLTLAFFGRAVWRAEQLRAGRRAMFAGQVSDFRGRRQLVHPDYVLLEDLDPDPDDQDPADQDPPDQDPTDPGPPDPGPSEQGPSDPAAAAFVGALIPVYPATAKVSSWVLARSVQVVLGSVEVPDPVPAQLIARHGLVDLATAFRAVHRPVDAAQLRTGRERLRFDDAFVPQVVLALRRADRERSPAVARHHVPGGLRDRLDAQLPFALTASQAVVGAELAADLARTSPMSRLLQGEVGSGKTVVALRAMLTVVDAGGQAVLLAPTEALAVQHHRSLGTLLGPLGRAGMLDGDPDGTRLALLTGSLPTAARKVALLDIASGAAGLVVGTHALLQERVSYAELGLVVVDEQHRFGVAQRAALTDPSGGGPVPHQLVMTATPIPRTVAMTVFGDLAVSTLDQVPTGRPPVVTTVVPTLEQPAWLDRAWERVVEEVRSGHQAFVVCPRIGGAEEEPSGDSGQPRGTALLDLAPELAAGPLAGVTCEVLHGRMPADDRDAVMTAFAGGRVDVLLATTVIEVGIDVPNATVMVVCDADRFGTSQLHQVRGRVGRGSGGGLCLLLTEAPAGSPGRERVETVAATSDGFALAEVDLAERREGDLLGATQSGRRTGFRVLSVPEDGEIIARARADAGELVTADPTLARYPDLLAHLADALPEARAGFLAKG